MLSAKLLGILVPGGFGERATEGKILAVNYARTNNIPFFGICLGMQLAAIEIARNLIGLKDAITEEFKTAGTKIIERISKNDEDFNPSDITIENVKKTMRLGSYTCNLVSDSIAANAYGELKISERHRHRYKFNNDFQDIFEKNGVKFSGFSEDKKIVEAIELPKLQWFVGVQFHPEFKSKPFEAHPLFIKFIEAAIKYNKNN